MVKAKRRIEYMPLASIAKAPRNVKDHDLGAIQASIGRFGFADAVVLDERTQRLVSGHGRVETLAMMKAVGGEPPDGIDKTEADWLVPVQRGWASTTDVEAEAFLVAANRLVELGGWEQATLEAVLVDLAKSGVDALVGTGYDADDVDRILREMNGAEEDTAPIVPANSWVKTGDLFALGTHRLLCGDSTMVEDVARLMGDERAGLMNTDPPYGVDYESASGKPKIANDQHQDTALQEFLTKAFKVAAECALTQNAAWYFWHANLTEGFFAAAAAAAAANVVLHRTIIWVKPQLLLGRGQYHWKHEPCFFGWVEGHQPPDYGEGNGERTQTTVWEIDGVKVDERREFNHATPKPVRLFEIPIVKHLERGEICFEPFAGTGPQFIAAEKTGRRCFGVEFEPCHVQTIIERWEKHTGQKAAKL